MKNKKERNSLEIKCIWKDATEMKRPEEMKKQDWDCSLCGGYNANCGRYMPSFEYEKRLRESDMHLM